MAAARYGWGLSGAKLWLEGTGGTKERRREGHTAVERLILPLDCSAHFCTEGAGSLKATPSRLLCQLWEAFFPLLPVTLLAASAAAVGDLGLWQREEVAAAARVQAPRFLQQQCFQLRQEANMPPPSSNWRFILYWPPKLQDKNSREEAGTCIDHIFLVSKVRRPPRPHLHREGSLEAKGESCQGMFYP